MQRPPVEPVDVATAAAANGRTLVLVEGDSDRAAVSALAARRGRDLDAEGITIVVIGGATGIARCLDVLGPRGMDADLAGLCDAGEERHFRHALESAGFGANLARSDLERLGFFVCDADLEDELIRALGVPATLAIAATQGELQAFKTFQLQPVWRDQSESAQLRRWLGTTSRRKLRYASLMVSALDLERTPAPLEHLLTYIAPAS